VIARVHRFRIERGFRRHAPWTTRFTIDGRAYGGDVDFTGDRRIADFRRAFPDARTVLDLGALEGAHAIELAKSADRVVAVEARRGNVERARFAAHALGVDNVEVVHADVEVAGPGAFGTFDAVFCSALLYHLQRPAALLDRLRGASANVYVWTHVAAPPGSDVHGIDRIRGEWRAEPDDHADAAGDPTVGLGPRSFWPTLDAVVARLRTHGYDDVTAIDEDHPAGPAATVIARATPR
jgi:SAM-dependent methyltransferase